MKPRTVLCPFCKRKMHLADNRPLIPFGRKPEYWLECRNLRCSAVGPVRSSLGGAIRAMERVVLKPARKVIK